MMKKYVFFLVVFSTKMSFLNCLFDETKRHLIDIFFIPVFLAKRKVD